MILRFFFFGNCLILLLGFISIYVLDSCNYGGTCNVNNSSRCLIENGKPMCWSKNFCQEGWIQKCLQI